MTVTLVLPEAPATVYCKVEARPAMAIATAGVAPGVAGNDAPGPRFRPKMEMISPGAMKVCPATTGSGSVRCLLVARRTQKRADRDLRT